MKSNPPLPKPAGLQVTSVDTYSDLRSSAGIANQAIVVNCRDTHGDGGGGRFYWGPAGPDNGGTVIAASDGSGSWYRVYDGAINICWFGVRGNDQRSNAVGNTAAINALFAEYASPNCGPEFYAPPGQYYFTRPAVDAMKTIEFERMTSAILRGAGKFATFFNYTAFPGETAAQKAAFAAEGVFFSFQRCSYSRVQDICIDGRDASVVDGSALASMAAQITSDGWPPPPPPSAPPTPLPFGDCFVNCYVCGYRDVGIQIGSRGKDRDINLDSDSVESCIIDGSDRNGLPGAGQYGIRVSNSNTNNFLARHNLIQGYGTGGIELSLYPRATYLDGNQFASWPGTATADIIVRSAVASFVKITNTIVELGDHPFIVQDRAGLAGPYSPADSTDECAILIDGFQNSYSWAPKVVVPYKIFDIQGCGANELANATISGPDDGDAKHPRWTAPISFHPVPGSNAGPRRLTTRNVHLYNGAVWDVPSGWGSGTAQVKWIDLGSSRSTDVYGADSTTPQLRLSDGTQVFASGGFRTPSAAQTIPSDQPMLATKTRAYTFTHERPEFVGKVASVDIAFETTPPMTRIVKVLAITRTPWAATWAGGITAALGNTGGGAASGTVDAYIVKHDITGPAPTIKGRFPTELGPALTGPTAYVGGDILNFNPDQRGQLTFHLESEGVLSAPEPDGLPVHPLGNGTRTYLTAGSTTIYVTYEEMIPTA
jgi:hypothetical protein